VCFTLDLNASPSVSAGHEGLGDSSAGERCANKTKQIKSNRIKSNQIKSNQIESNQIKSNQIESNQIKSNQIKSNRIESKQKQYNTIQNKTKQNKRRMHAQCITLALQRALERARALLDAVHQLLHVPVPRVNFAKGQLCQGSSCSCACDAQGWLIKEKGFVVFELMISRTCCAAAPLWV
jgi:hypothetical protein